MAREQQRITLWTLRERLLIRSQELEAKAQEHGRLRHELQDEALHLRKQAADLASSAEELGRLDDAGIW